MRPTEIRMSLGSDKNAPGAARRELRGRLEDVVEPEVLERAMLLVSELVTNSVRHAGLHPGEKIHLTVQASADLLHVEVAETGQGFDLAEIPSPRHDGPPGGWGLYLVDRLSSAWGVEGGGVTKVWFEVDSGARSRAS